jgi:hypothetical protein
MSLGVEYEVVKADDARFREGEEEVLERLRHPEALFYVSNLLAHTRISMTYLHAIRPRRRSCRNILQRGVADICIRAALDSSPHVPGHGLPLLLAGDAVHDKDAFDGLGAEDVASVFDGSEAGW